jgi:hypothetical protein
VDIYKRGESFLYICSPLNWMVYCTPTQTFILSNVGYCNSNETPAVLIYPDEKITIYKKQCLPITAAGLLSLFTGSIYQKRIILNLTTDKNNKKYTILNMINELISMGLFSNKNNLKI